MLYEHSAPSASSGNAPAPRQLPGARLSATDDAAALLRVLHARILAGAAPVPGHADAARLIGLPPTAAGYVGTLCRLIDRACREIGVPPLAAQWVHGIRSPARHGIGRLAYAPPAAPGWTDADLQRLRDRLAATVPKRPAATAARQSSG